MDEAGTGRAYQHCGCAGHTELRGEREGFVGDCAYCHLLAVLELEGGVDEFAGGPVGIGNHSDGGGRSEVGREGLERLEDFGDERIQHAGGAAVGVWARVRDLVQRTGD